jgi:hypothetical protein
VGKFVTHDLSGIGICDQAQVNPFVPDADVGDVTYPYLLGTQGLPALHKVGPLFETVVGLGGDGIPAFAFDQKVIFAQQPEESVPSQSNHCTTHFFDQYAAEFKGTHAMGVLPNFTYPRQHKPAANGVFLFSAHIFIVGLPCSAK